MSRRIINILLCAVLGVVTASCFTGIEGTKKITDKDVRREVKGMSEEEVEANSLALPVDSFVNWRKGKSFFSCDENLKLIFLPSDKYDSDTLQLKDKILRYDGYYLGSVLDNREIVNIQFTDENNAYTYSTGKTIEELTSSFSIPFLIDLDVVDYINGMLQGKEVYVKTSIWYELNEAMTTGKKFVKVRIDSVKPGNKVFPIKVIFTDIESDMQFMLWMTTGGTVLKNRSFDALFSYTDVRLRYPQIDDDVWNCIVNGRTKVGMTRDEVRLSLGAPASVSQRPTYNGVREYWYYSDGKYYYFEDGLLIDL